MNTIAKTAEQIEFAEIFERLEKEFEQSQADVARALRLERSYISMLLKGTRNPALRTIEDMRALEKRLRAVAEGLEPEVRSNELEDLVNRLAAMERQDKATFETARRVIQSLAPQPAPAGSGSEKGAAKLLKKISASHNKRGGKRSS